MSSLAIGLVGSLLLIDGHHVVLPLPQFYLGFALITIAFPFGRNVSLSIFSKILGPTEQGTWFGYMFAAGALPRIFGPSWSLEAVELVGRGVGGEMNTGLEFSITGGLFVVGVLLCHAYRREIKPYGEE